jgi:hypothetical protein
VKVEEVARRLKLRAELLRWTTDIERAGRHDAIENGLPPLGQFHAGRYQGDPDEVAIGRRYGLVLRGGLRVLPSRSRDGLGLSIAIELAPLPFMKKRMRALKDILALRTVSKTVASAICLHVGKHHSFLPDLVAVVPANQARECNKSDAQTIWRPPPISPLSLLKNCYLLQMRAVDRRLHICDSTVFARP